MLPSTNVVIQGGFDHTVFRQCSEKCEQMPFVFLEAAHRHISCTSAWHCLRRIDNCKPVDISGLEWSQSSSFSPMLLLGYSCRAPSLWTYCSFSSAVIRFAHRFKSQRGTSISSPLFASPLVGSSDGIRLVNQERTRVEHDWITFQVLKGACFSLRQFADDKGQTNWRIICNISLGQFGQVIVVGWRLL